MLRRILQVFSLAALAVDAAGGESLFVGSTPCDGRARAFLGGLSGDAPCMFINWRLRLTGERRYDLAAVYGIPTRGNPNVAEEGPRVERQGAWEIERGTAADPGAVVFRLRGAEPGRSLAFVRIGETLLHLLSPEKRLLAGDGGWSYTLNLSGTDTLADRSPEARAKAPSPARVGAPHTGVFDGRTPCQVLARRLALAVGAECFKLKWRLRLHASTYVLEGTPYRAAARRGRWAIRDGVYQLDPDSPGRSLAFLRVDEDVLLFLDEDGQPLVGNADFSYTLSRQR